jgi:hypothetical protein
MRSISTRCKSWYGIGYNISSVVGIGLITSYISSSNSIKGVGNQVKKLSSAHSRITDLFTFMRGFGQQTFPVLDEKQILK